VVSEKYLCLECHWHGTETLEAPNPFAEDNEKMLGCPGCREANRITLACDEPDCWRETTCGTPTPDGYRRTCGEHMPRD
jgi:hypothetical protein